MSSTFSKRIAAIVGRPNVGKSAMFNRIIRRRLSIVHEEAGVTRDRVSTEVLWNSESFELIDTGGLGYFDKEGTQDSIESNLREQALAAIEDAEVIIFAVDITAGITPLDREVAGLLHKSARTVLLAANKADTESVDKLSDEFSSLGFPVFPVAALHNRGFEPLMSAVLKNLPEEEKKDKKDALKVVVSGKPNAGKSSFINRLIRSNRLIVSDVPGTTRDSVEIPFSLGEGISSRNYVLIDTAGLRHIRRQSNAIEKYSVIRSEESIEAADVVILMIDAEVGPTAQDKKIAGLIIDNRKGCIIAVNKWDLAQGEVSEESYENALRKELPFLSFAPIVFISAESGYNIKNCLRKIDLVAANIDTTITTGTLNRVLKKATTRVAAPADGSKRFKLYYATQIGTRPIRINIFANNPRALPKAYRLYLMNQLRAAYGMEGAPIVLAFKSSHGDRDSDSKNEKKRRPARRRPKR